MMNRYHNRNGGRAILTLLLVLSVLAFWTAPARADNGCQDVCNSPLMNENHTPPEGTDLENCPAPVPLFCACPRIGCDSLTVDFYDYSTGYIDTWAWDFGDPASGADNYSGEEYPTHFYSAPGVYTVTLTVTGCGGTETKTWHDCIEVKASPTADFRADNLEGCVLDPICFTDLSTGAIMWRWEFGDGDVSFEQNPCHAYAAPGTYTVSLKVMNECGKDTKVSELYITIYDGPTAAFDAAPRSGQAPLQVDFTDQSTSPTGLTGWLWDFGDGGTSDVQHPSHTYTAPGLYTVRLTVTDRCGTDTAIKTEYVYVTEPCKIDFTAEPAEGCAPLTVYFSGLSTGPCEISAWTWDFGDPNSGSDNTATGRDADHTYLTPGVYTVVLTATDITGDIVVTKADVVTVYGGPTAEFDAAPRSGYVPLTVDFTDRSTSQLGITSWQWDFGDGSGSADQHPTHTYTAPGLYTVTLTVVDPCGEDSETKTEYIFIEDTCRVDFVAEPLDGCAPLTVSFVGQADGQCEIEVWEWDFGDPASGADNGSTDRAPQHIYHDAGVYTVTLRLYANGNTLVETKTDYITVYANVTADFEATPRYGEAPLTVDFTDLSTGADPIVIRQWDFGDGSGSVFPNPTHTYAAPGRYTVTLYVSTDHCNDQAEKVEYIEVIDPCTADFDGEPLESCNWLSATFTGRVLGECEVLSWTWDFGDQASGADNTGSGRIGNHIYDDPGVYTVSLTVAFASGDTVITRNDYVTVYANPTADFEATPRSGYAPLTVDFTDLSTSVDPIVFWEWDFGDGQTSLDPEPTHIYAAPGWYPVTLTIRTDYCMDLVQKIEYIEVKEPCTVDFSGDPLDICVYETVYFTGTSQGECEVTSWTWDFGDPASGADNTASGQNPEHQYDRAGLYTVTLTATVAGTDTVITRTDYVTVHDGPTAAFDATPMSGVAPLAVTFTDQSTSDVGGLMYTWRFGDGTLSGDRNPTHTYTSAGDYQVILEVEDRCGIDSEIDTIHVAEACTIDFSGNPLNGCAPLTVEFESESDGDCAIDSWTWDFGDPGSGPANLGTGQTPSHTYHNVGTYTVSLTATDTSGTIVKTKTDYITVYGTIEAAFDASPRSGEAPLTVDFTDHSTSDMPIIAWIYDFGDGDSSFYEPDPTHTYTAAGVYAVSLFVGNDCTSDREEKLEYVYVTEPCTIDFYGSPLEGCAPLDASFTGTSTGPCEIETWVWDFGDPASGSDNSGFGQTANHVYNSPGVYTVTLTATDITGTKFKTKQDYVRVIGLPTANFRGTPRVGLAPLTVAFTDESVPGEQDYVIRNWQWDFGDGTTSNIPNPSHTYTAAGDYAVSLTIEGTCGPDTEVKEVYIGVHDSCKVDFTGEPLEGCAPLDAHFSGTSTGSCLISIWRWDFGDPASGPLNVGYGPQVGHSYQSPGVYTVTLTAADASGDIVVTKTDYVTVNGGPTAAFDASPLSGRAPLQVDFTDHSTSALGLLTWAWDFGDGGTANVQNPSHSYTVPGTYTVTLTVTDPCGEDSETREAYVYVLPPCYIDFFTEVSDGCAPFLAYFGASSTGPCEIISWTWDFGDPASGPDNIGTGQYPTHTYDNPGVYTVMLTATDASGQLVVTKADYITVFGGPTADFIATPTAGDAPLLVAFTDLSVSGLGIQDWDWDFGDGATSDLRNPTHTFADTGSYTVTMIITDPCGTDTATTEIDVRPLVAITKTVDVPVARQGEEILYTLTVTSLSQQPIYHVTVLDTLAPQCDPVAGTITGGGYYDASGDQVVWDLPTIDPLQTINLTFRVVLNGPFRQLPDTVRNQGLAIVAEEAIATSAARTFYSNIVQTIVEPGEPIGGLEIVKAVSANRAAPNDQLTYTLTITNSEVEAAVNVVIRDAVPDLTTLVAGSISGGGQQLPGTDNLQWNIGSLGINESRSVTFDVTIDADAASGSVIPNTGMVTFVMIVSGIEDDATSNEVQTVVNLAPLVITKTCNRPSGRLGDLVRFTITVDNYSGDVFENVIVHDTMPAGIFPVDGTSLLNGAALADPTGDNPYEWALGDLPVSGSFTLEYVALISASAHRGLHENVARSHAVQNSLTVHSNRAVARIFVVSSTLYGSIRGRVIVDCDGDGVADMDTVPSGMDVYLDEGSHSRVNDKGMFYFSTVRAGERVVALDERDLEGFFIPEGAQASVFVHVHETGESYVIFRVCPDYPHLDIRKKAAIVPTVKVTKKAKVDPEQAVDSLGVKIDYEIDIKSNGLADPTKVRVVDSLPSDMHLILAESRELAPKRSGSELVYEVTAAQERLQKSVFYSLQDMTPGMRRFLSNKVHLEGDLAQTGDQVKTVSSEPVEVAAGPFLLAPPQDVLITLTPALFITSKAFLQPPAIPQLEAAADSILKYVDAEIEVNGHTDFRPIHTKEFPSNWELGEARARAVVDWLVDNRGIDRDRLKFESFAATVPVVVDVPRTSVALQPNRRTEVIVKAKLGGFFDPAAMPAYNWESSTSMALDPVKFDTLFEPAPSPAEIALDDSWEVVLTVENNSAIAAENTDLTDIMPNGVEYIEGSATLDGLSVPAAVSGNTLSLTLARVAPKQMVELRYRVRALEGVTPSGGGAASIEVMTSTNLPVIQKSNAVRFK